MATQITKKRKFVGDGVFFAELNEVLTRELAEDGYSGVEVRVTPMRTEIIIRAIRTKNVLAFLFFPIYLSLTKMQEVIVSGKLRAQHAKSMKFKDGYMISSGQPVKEYIDSAVRHVLLRQGVLGIKVKIICLTGIQRASRAQRHL
ncbi:ribosomal protein S3 component of cytosolic 80S ribosome and 40S small subunit [Tripterygium wilfordii]|uniref:Ribosomal protein S3 component of cytosolic 80S ribosome and 40S small subunit n=1 Tax=Tripterygium wilfordii TaxID=458696 RepID=A0A7J7D9Y2_TRIWF|nr:ribosomal protein S3 component of cytosolic 80S ribosome and 40S small subunit [Tripterygium wilfordii]